MFTLVSGLLPCLDRKRVESDWIEFAKLLRLTGLPSVLYVEPGLINKLDIGAKGGAGAIVLRPLDESSLRQGLWLNENFQALTHASGENPDEELKRIVRLRALGWLHDESIFNPHASQGFVWLDPLLLDEVQPAYLASNGSLSLIEPLLDPMLLLANLDGADGRGFSEALFGGLSAELPLINQAYWQVYAHLISQHKLPTFTSIMSILWHELPGSFQSFNLQSNGLAGSFFEAMRAGPVSLETLHLSS
jgi:hypothetical protein